jgi:hypothetical protein
MDPFDRRVMLETVIEILYKNSKGQEKVHWIKHLSPGCLGYTSKHEDQAPSFAFRAFDLESNKYRNFYLTGIRAWGSAAVRDVAKTAERSAYFHNLIEGKK